MAKTSKNKTKLWRRMAVKVNEMSGTKHQGRMIKHQWREMPAVTTPILTALFKNAGIDMKPQIVYNDSPIQEGEVNEAK